MDFRLIENIKVAPGDDGISIVTVKVPSYMADDFLRLLSAAEDIVRHIRFKTRCSEALYRARQLKIVP